MHENLGISLCRDGDFCSDLEPVKYKVFQVWKAHRVITVMLHLSHPAQQPMEEPKEMSPAGDGHEKQYQENVSSLAGIKVSAGITQPSAAAVFHTRSTSFFKS